jgi:type 1 glutamine amidotransferase
MKKALIVQGGWVGHDPVGMAAFLAERLRENGVEVTISDTLDAFAEMDLTAVDLIVPMWTMGTIKKEQLTPLLDAVRGGVGLAGVHGGMADSFRNETDYQFMVGGQWVAHPGGGGVTYTVHIDGEPSPITAGVPDFVVTSEQYYMHVDPAIHVLATTRFGETKMPVAWTTHYGKGRVFYMSVGHTVDSVRPNEPCTIITRGMLWAAESKQHSA